MTPPSALAALALVAAGAAVLLAAVLGMTTASAEAYGFVEDFGLLNRVQIGASLVSVPLLLLVPVALALLRQAGGERSTAVPPAVVQAVTAGAVLVGGGSCLLVLSGLVADLGGDAQLVVGSKSSAFFIDSAAVLVAVAGTAWAYRELRGDHPPAPPPPAPGRGG
ncbi:MAG: hypothetical protein ACRDZ9_06495 [Acidimicrobiales bacterium]